MQGPLAEPPLWQACFCSLLWAGLRSATAIRNRVASPSMS